MKRNLFGSQIFNNMVSAKSEKPVIGLSTLDKSLAKIVDIGLPIPPGDEWKSDLVGDVFFANMKRTSSVLENPPEGREVNAAIMRWMFDSGFDNKETAGNIPASIMASGTSWGTLIQSGVVDEALKKQKEADEERQKAKDAEEEAKKKEGDGDMPGAINARNRAKDHRNKADSLIKDAVDGIDAKSQNPLSQKVMKSTVEKGDKSAKDTNAIMKTWGIEPGDINNKQDVKRIVELANNPLVRKMAELVGRAKGISSDKINDVARRKITDAAEGMFTKDLRYVTSANKAKLFSDDEMVRALAFTQYVETGLFGFVPKQTITRKPGSSIMIVDGSGSMGTDGCMAEKAMCLGVGQAIRELLDAERYYELYEFSYGHTRYVDGEEKIIIETFPQVKSTDDWRAHLDWCGTYLCGGTDFDAAFRLAVERLKVVREMGIEGCDLSFWSDGYGGLSREVINEFEELKSQISVRLTYFQIGRGGDENLKKLADYYVDLPDTESLNDENLIARITEIVAEHYLDGYGSGD